MIVVRGYAVKNLDRTTSHTGYGLHEAFVHALFETTSIERVKVRIKSCVAISRHDVFVRVWIKSFSEKVSHVAEDN